jgi:hypothetical protein
LRARPAFQLTIQETRDLQTGIKIQDFLALDRPLPPLVDVAESLLNTLGSSFSNFSAPVLLAFKRWSPDEPSIDNTWISSPTYNRVSLRARTIFVPHFRNELHILLIAHLAAGPQLSN